MKEQLEDYCTSRPGLVTLAMTALAVGLVAVSTLSWALGEHGLPVSLSVALGMAIFATVIGQSLSRESLSRTVVLTVLGGLTVSVTASALGAHVMSLPVAIAVSSVAYGFILCFAETGVAAPALFLLEMMKSTESER